MENPNVQLGREDSTKCQRLSVRLPRGIPAIKPFLIYSYLAGTWSPFSSPSHSMCWPFSGLDHCQCLFWTLGKNSYRLTMRGVIFCSPSHPASQCPKALVLLLFSENSGGEKLTVTLSFLFCFLFSLVILTSTKPEFIPHLHILDEYVLMCNCIVFCHSFIQQISIYF